VEGASRAKAEIVGGIREVVWEFEKEGEDVAEFRFRQ
jgi:hypothetical protein